MHGLEFVCLQSIYYSLLALYYSIYCSLCTVCFEHKFKYIDCSINPWNTHLNGSTYTIAYILPVTLQFPFDPAMYFATLFFFFFWYVFARKIFHFFFLTQIVLNWMRFYHFLKSNVNMHGWQSNFFFFFILKMANMHQNWYKFDTNFQKK